MQTTIRLPEELESLAGEMGIQPKAAAHIVLDWFVQPLTSSGIMVHRQRRKLGRRQAKFRAAVEDFAVRVKLNRTVVMDRLMDKSMREAAA